MSFTTPAAVPSGMPATVLEVGGHPPGSLQDFAGDTSFSLGGQIVYTVHGTGTVTGDTVRFHEKDVEHNGKDIRVWQVRRSGDDEYVAEHAPTF